MPTPKQEYAAALQDVVKRFSNLTEETLNQSITFLRQFRERLQLRLTSAEGFDAARLEEMIAAVNQQVAQFEAQMLGLTNGALRQSAQLGAASVVDPLAAAGLTSGFYQPSPAQINVLLDFSADLITKISEQMRRDINREIRLAALAERSSFDAMRNISDILGIPAGRRKVAKGVAYEAERILRTEQGRVYSAATQSQLGATAQQVPDLEKQWLSTGDSRTRACHLLAHGQIVKWNEPFSVCNEKLMFPRDPAGSAGNTINCRCDHVAVHPEIGPVGTPLDARVGKEQKRRQNGTKGL